MLGYHLIIKSKKRKSFVYGKGENNTDPTNRATQNSQESNNTDTNSEKPLTSQDLLYLNSALATIRTVIERVKDLDRVKVSKKQTISVMRRLAASGQNQDPSGQRNSISYKENFNSDEQKPNLQFLYDSYFSEHWLMAATILNIAQLQFLTAEDSLFIQTVTQEEICPEIIIEKVSLLVVCFYAISTEYRFKEKLSEIEELQKQEQILLADRESKIQAESSIPSPNSIKKSPKLEEKIPGREASHFEAENINTFSEGASRFASIDVSKIATNPKPKQPQLDICLKNTVFES